MALNISGMSGIKELIRYSKIFKHKINYLIGGLDQQARLETMSKARNFQIRVLVCSDLVQYLKNLTNSFL